MSKVPPPIRLRKDVATAPGAAGAKRKKGSHAGRRALLVEAEAGTRELCQNLLERWGFYVTAVESGIEAIKATRHQLPDLIVLDQQLRDVPGREIVAWLRSNPALRATPIITVSAFAGDGVTGEIEGVAAVLTKPLSAASFERAIREIFG